MSRSDKICRDGHTEMGIVQGRKDGTGKRAWNRTPKPDIFATALLGIFHLAQATQSVRAAN